MTPGNTSSRVTCSPGFIASCTAASPAHLDFFVTALDHTSAKDLSLAPQVLLQERDSGAVWRVLAMQSIKVGCKEVDVVFSQWDLTGLNLGFPPKCLVLESFGVCGTILSWVQLFALASLVQGL